MTYNYFFLFTESEMMIVLFGVLFAMTKRAPKIVSNPKSTPAKEAIA